MWKAILPASAAGFYAYDTFQGGAKVNRSARAAYAGVATFIEYKFVLGRSDQPLERIHTRVAERWLWCVQQNGGLYTKLAQAISSMNHVLPREYIQTLQVVQDQAPTVSSEEVEQVLMEEFGKPSSEIFATFENKAIASASIAQVHQATLKDGTLVAVKIQKPQIRKQIDADLFMYQVLAFFIEKAFDLPVQWSVPYTCAQLRQETDFNIESNNSKLARDNIEVALKKSVTIPDVFPDYSTSRVLTTEWIQGVKITDMEGVKKLGFKGSEIMEIVTKFFSHQLFVSGHLQYVP